MKKILSVLMSVAMIAASAVAFSGCFLMKEEYLPEYESGFFKYAVKTLDDGSKVGTVIGLTETGEQQTSLVFPAELDGIPIVACGYSSNRWPYDHMLRRGLIDERYPNIKKLYFPKTGFVLSENPITHIQVADIWLQDCKFIGWDIAVGGNAYGYYGGKVYGYNVLKDNLGQFTSLLANVSYLNNYEGAPNDGYYWVDSCDNCTIDFIPPEPTREGYTFGGWYKEAECINEWNFETDITKNEIPIKYGKKYEDYKREDITELYAKWIANN